MANIEAPDLSKYIKEWSSDLHLLLQNTLLSEGQFMSFAKERGITVVPGDPKELHDDGWLSCDGLQGDTLLFHPFRLYPLFTVLRHCKFNIAPSAFLRRENLGKLIEYSTDRLPQVEQLKDTALISNRIADAAILLEPLYWPRMAQQTRYPGGLDENEREPVLDQYKSKVIAILKTCDLSAWEKIHEKLRFDAAQMDDNRELYLLLRLSSWGRRKELKGVISAALWIRHIAEVIRRGFEEVFGIKWKEEDEAFGVWFPDARAIRYGQERPLDNETIARPHLAWNYQLLTGSAARWYVEGETEYHAVLHVLPNPASVNIELINLRGNVASERDNIAMKFKDSLITDKLHKRFSIISLDRDVKENVKFVERQIASGNIVGFIAMHNPDFEFANFTINELAEIAAQFDEAYNAPADIIRTADWTGVKTGKAFEIKYKTLSSRLPASLKGEEWGKALANYALEHPHKSNGDERPFWKEVRAALQARFADYRLHCETMKFDPNTFDLVDNPQV